MSAITKTILFLLYSFFLCKCQTNIEESSEAEKVTNFMAADRVSPSIAGEWKYSFPFYSSELVFRKNGTFSFHERGCTGHGYSEGSWKIKGETYFLTSFDQFKSQKKFTVTSEPVINNRNRTRSKRTKYKLELYPLNQNVEVRFPDTSNVYFDNAIFRINANTLVRFDERGNITDSKFAKQQRH